MTTSSRRDFIKWTAAGAAGAAFAPFLAQAQAAQEAAPDAAATGREYGISLAGWSLHKSIGEGEGKIPMLDMPRLAREEFGIEAIELVNRMLASDDQAYIDQFKKNAADHNVKILLIMIDGEGDIGHRSEKFRGKAVEQHKHWIDIAADMGCHSVRMNWGGAPVDWQENAEALQEFIDRSVPGFRALCEYGETKNINVIIENHGGPSSYIEPMKTLMAAVDHPRFGTLPDFGNFPPEVDKYEGIDVLMNYAKAVSAKCYGFDPETGLETKIDYPRMIEIVVDKHGYKGFIGIEYEGEAPEFEGIKACKALLEKLKTA
jgi:sugar phosphate isomerase/epimerase